jgi:predicted nucleotidyltransferase
MKNTSQTLTPRADLKVDPITLSVIREIHKAAEQLGFEVFIVGAIARIILLEYVYGLSAGRTTSDIDFAFAAEDWEQFKKIKNYLIEHSYFRESQKQVHKLFFKSPEWEFEFEVDLIPFGEIESKPNTIKWPPDMSVMMNVAGYQDALDSAIKVKLEPELIISVASLPGIAILKIFAWADREKSTSKDAQDLAALLRGYSDAGNQIRIYEDQAAIAALAAADYDVELTGAWLLGKDAAEIASKETHTEILALINSPRKRRLEEDMARAMLGRSEALTYAERLLQQFTDGFTA